jgi:hypothetical protein
MDAIKLGRTIFNRNPEVMEREFNRLSPTDQEYLRLGVADIMRERLKKTGLSGDEAKALIKNEWIREQIRPIFRSAEDFEKFTEAVSRENKLFESKQGLIGGSATQARSEADKAWSMGADAAAAAVTGGMHGNILSAAQRAMIATWRNYKNLGLRDNPELNAKISQILFKDIDPTTEAMLRGKVPLAKINKMAKPAAQATDLARLATMPATTSLERTDEAPLQ